MAFICVSAVQSYFDSGWMGKEGGDSKTNDFSTPIRINKQSVVRLRNRDLFRLELCRLAWTKYFNCYLVSGRLTDWRAHFIIIFLLSCYRFAQQSDFIYISSSICGNSLNAVYYYCFTANCIL